MCTLLLCDRKWKGKQTQEKRYKEEKANYEREGYLETLLKMKKEDRGKRR